MNDRVYELWDLEVGTLFEVVGLEQDYRKMVLTGLTQGAAVVKGESSLDDETIVAEGEKKRNWKALTTGTTFSLRTPVRKI